MTQPDQPRLVRILETFEADLPHLDPELTALRGRLCRYLGTTDQSGEELYPGCIAFQYAPDGGWAIAAQKEYEIVSPIDTSKARVGDRVRVGATQQVVEIATVEADGTLRSRWGGTEIAQDAVIRHEYIVLVSSDTPLG